MTFSHSVAPSVKMRSASYQNLGSTGSTRVPPPVPVVPDAGRRGQRGERSGVFDELERQRTGRLEVRPTLFLGNAPEVVRRGPIDAKTEREAPRIRPFFLKFVFRLLGADPWRRPDGDRISDNAYCEPATPTSVIVIRVLLVETGSSGPTQPSRGVISTPARFRS